MIRSDGRITVNSHHLGVTANTMNTRQRAPSRVPEFKSVQEAAEFWDTHSTADFEDWWEPTDLEFAPDWKSVRLLSVEIDYSLYRALRARAEGQGTTAEELAATWIEAKLAESSEARTTDTSTGTKG